MEKGSHMNSPTKKKIMNKIKLKHLFLLLSTESNLFFVCVFWFADGRFYFKYFNGLLKKTIIFINLNWSLQAMQLYLTLQLLLFSPFSTICHAKNLSATFIAFWLGYCPHEYSSNFAVSRSLMVTCKRPDLLEVLTTFMMEIILSTPAVEIPMVIVNKRKVLISVRPNITTHSNCFRCSFQAFKRWRNIWLCSLQHYGEETCDLGVWHNENFHNKQIKRQANFVVMNKWKESSDGVTWKQV